MAPIDRFWMVRLVENTFDAFVDSGYSAHSKSLSQSLIPAPLSEASGCEVAVIERDCVNLPRLNGPHVSLRMTTAPQMRSVTIRTSSRRVMGGK
jgi:hypothetical protein